MMTHYKKIHTLVAAMLYGMLAASPAAADDTEIYLGQNLGVTDVPPNILFVVDTSGSMDTNVTTQTTYDPGTTYSGSCSTTRVYYNADKFTKCSGSSPTSNYFELANLKCKAAIDAFATSGFYQDNMAMWRSNQWKIFSSSAHTVDVECKADSGVHGNGGTATYAANGGSGPWSTNSSNSINWTTATSYTIKSGNYLNWEQNAATITKTRIQIVKDTLTSLVNSINNVNIGLMRFDSNANGGMVIHAMEPIATARTNFLTAVNGLPADSYTPLSETMYEAAMYYKGGAVDYGNTSSPVKSVAASRVGSVSTSNTYNSPIDFQCQKNFIAYLTDGDPTQDTGVGTTRQTNVGISGGCSVVGSGSYQSNCMDDIASAIAKNDQSTGGSGFADKQVVSTYTIGFGTGMSSAGITLLKSTASASKAESGAGAYYAASDSVELTAAFTNILTDILGVSSTFSSPAVSVNAFNRTTHRDDLYFSLFKPAAGPHWDGNFKRYRLEFDTDGNPFIVDVNNQPAVNSLNGYFYDTSTSYWTPVAYAPDGKDAPEGGAASKLTNNRTVYTYMGSNNSLTDSSNRVHETNATITDAMLGVAATERDNVLKWARGIDVKDVDGDGDVTDERLIMGDPLHGEPAMIQYGGTDADPDITAYVPTNEGYLHAINTMKSAGTETFSFVPKELFSVVGVHYTANNAITKTYGLDSSITSWIQDQNKDGVLDAAAGDKAYIYFGMRRGGNNYYALDVSDRSNPKFMWSIIGGTGDFTEMGQSWSQPQLRKLRVNNADKHVLIFAGGYDTNQDAVSQRTVDGAGRAVYIVDAMTGARLWWASSQTGANLTLTNMQYSIPSNVAAADANGDGYADAMYVGDMGGQIWRFDIAKGAAGSTLSTLITGGRIADLAANGNKADNRRFYYPPSVSLTKNGGDTYLSLGIASGYREHPLNKDIEDRIYMLKDKPVFGKPATYVTLTEADLFDTTDNLVREGTSIQREAAKTAMDQADGWYIKLETTGEKGLAKGLIFNDYLYITSYIPTDTSAASQACSPSEGTGRLYIVSVKDGGPLNTSSGTTPPGTVSPGDLKDKRYDPLVKPGIPADPKMIKTANTNQKDYAVCVGTECEKAPDTNTHETLYWFER